MALETRTQMVRSPPGGVVVAAAFEGDEIEDLGERIVSLTPGRLKSIRGYLKTLLGSDSLDPATDQPPPA